MSRQQRIFQIVRYEFVPDVCPRHSPPLAFRASSLGLPNVESVPMPPSHAGTPPIFASSFSRTGYSPEGKAGLNGPPNYFRLLLNVASHV